MTSSLESTIKQHLAQYFSSHAAGSMPAPGLYQRVLPMMEKPLIELTLQATGGNQVRAAQVLGLNRNTLRKKMQQLAIGNGKAP
jgi:two-component system nitrogen regulation response regulator GlnG